MNNEWNHVYCYRGPVDCVIHSDDVLHEKKKPGNNVANSAVLSKASSPLGVFPSERRMRSSTVSFLSMFRDSKNKNRGIRMFCRTDIQMSPFKEI